MTSQDANNIQPGCTVVTNGVTYVKLATGELVALAVPPNQPARVAKKSSSSPSAATKCGGIQLSRVKSKRVPLMLPTDPYQAAAKIMALNDAVDRLPGRHNVWEGPNFVNQLCKIVSRPGEHAAFAFAKKHRISVHTVPVYVVQGHYALYHKGQTIVLCKEDVTTTFEPQPHTFVVGRKYLQRSKDDGCPVQEWKCSEILHEGDHTFVSLSETSKHILASEYEIPVGQFNRSFAQKSQTPACMSVYDHVGDWGGLCGGGDRYVTLYSTDEIDPIQQMADKWSTAHRF